MIYRFQVDCSEIYNFNGQFLTFDFNPQVLDGPFLMFNCAKSLNFHIMQR
jgi:hypothetical protein